MSQLTITVTPSPKPTATVAPVIVKPWYQTMITDTATISWHLRNALLVTWLDQRPITYTLSNMYMGSTEKPAATLKYQANFGSSEQRFEQSQSPDGQSKNMWSIQQFASNYGSVTEYIDPKTHLTFQTDTSDNSCIVQPTRIGEDAWGDAASLMVKLLPFVFDTVMFLEEDHPDLNIRYVGNYQGVELIDGQLAYHFKLDMSQTWLERVVQYKQFLESGDIWITVVDGRNQIKRVSINTTDRIDDGGRPRQNEMLYGELVAAQPQDYAVPAACKKMHNISLTATPQYIDDIHGK